MTMLAGIIIFMYKCIIIKAYCDIIIMYISFKIPFLIYRPDASAIARATGTKSSYSLMYLPSHNPL